MSEFKVHILGCGSATPSLRHMPSCQVVEHRRQLLMVDCGEGAQLAMRRMGLKFAHLNHIFLSHLHGDHCLGLPGLLSTLALHGVGGTVTVHTFEEGARLLGEMVDFFCRERTYDLKFNIIDPTKRQLLLDQGGLTVESFPLQHRVADVGFLFREKEKPRHIKGDMVKFHQVPVSQMKAIKEGADFTTPDGRVIPNAMLTSDPDPRKSYAYCSDTVYLAETAKFVDGVDLLYHEATYADDNAHKAAKYGHSTASDAARVARDAHAGRLVIGHYSKAYHDEEQHLREAREIFPDTIAAQEGMTIDV